MRLTRNTRNILAALALATLVPGPRSLASTSQLAWDPPTLNTDGTPVTNLAGYIVYYGTENGNYDNSIDVGNVTTCTLPELTDGQTYFATIKAYSTFGTQSDNADQLTWLAPDEIAPSITAPEQIALTAGENDEAAIPNVILLATIIDNSSDPGAISITQTPTAGTMVGLGTTPVTLAATDEEENTAQAVINILVVAMNRPPQVFAGSDRSTRLPQDKVTLEGTATDDGLPTDSVVITEWSLVSGPAPVEFTDAHSLNTKATFAEEGTYILRLTATDGELTATDDVTITVTPKPVPMPPSNFHAVHSR